MGVLRSSNTALSKLQREINHLMNTKLWDESEEDFFNLGTDWVPAVDVKTEKDHYTIRADVPGVNPDDIDIRLDHEMLTIRGSRKDEKKTEENGFQRVERFSGSFFRRLSLPGSMDSDKVKAKIHDGVLEVSVPRSEMKEAKRISVTAN